MKKTSWLIIFGAVIFSLFYGRPLIAQSGMQSGVDAVAPPRSVPAVTEVPAATPTQPVEREPERQYFSALDGSGLIDMDQLDGPRIFIGATIASGWDSNPQNLAAGHASAMYNLSPYLEAHASTPRNHFLVQYQPTFGRYSAYGAKTMHVVSGQFVRQSNARSTLTVNATGSHGEDSLRLNNPIQSVSIGTPTGASPNAASYLPNAGVITNIEGGAELSYELSPRSSVRIRLANSYTSVPALSKSSNVVAANLSYERRFTSTWTFLAYQRDTQYVGSLRCTTVGGGAGIQWQPSGSLSVSASAGPQIDTPSCTAQQGFAYRVAVSKTMPHSSQAYVYAAREPSSGYLGPGLWQDGVTAGYRRQVQHLNAFAVEASFLRSTSLLTTGSYQGLLLDANYTRTLRSGPVLGVSYRNYRGHAEQISFQRNMAIFSIAWTPRLGSHFAH